MQWRYFRRRRKFREFQQESFDLQRAQRNQGISRVVERRHVAPRVRLLAVLVPFRSHLAPCKNVGFVLIVGEGYLPGTRNIPNHGGVEEGGEVDGNGVRQDLVFP